MLRKLISATIRPLDWGDVFVRNSFIISRNLLEDITERLKRRILHSVSFTKNKHHRLFTPHARALLEVARVSSKWGDGFFNLLALLMSATITWVSGKVTHQGYSWKTLSIYTLGCVMTLSARNYWPNIVSQMYSDHDYSFQCNKERKAARSDIFFALPSKTPKYSASLTTSNGFLRRISKIKSVRDTRITVIWAHPIHRQVDPQRIVQLVQQLDEAVLKKY